MFARIPVGSDSKEKRCHILETDSMERENVSFPNTFVLLGFSEFPWLERPLSAVVLVTYILTLVGNSSIIILSLVDPRLQMPMYFFLDNLSLLDLGLTCTIVPQLLANLWGPEKSIAAWGCITQVFLFCWTITTECALLFVMAIDCYLVICRPFQYTLILHPWVCMQMAAASWSRGLANCLFQGTLTVQLPLCGTTPWTTSSVSHILETDSMERENVSFPNTFVLLGFSEFPWLERPLSAVVLVTYILTLVGNSSIIILSLVDPRLQMPMYFFLDNLSLLDLGLTCTIVPQLLANLWQRRYLLINLACGDTTANKLAIILASIPLGMVKALLVVISYTFITRAVLKLPSAEGRHKALSTCSSHLLVVTMYFGPGTYLYLQPSTKRSHAKFMSFFYCIIAPVLNPLIYTLRNKDVKTAWKRILQTQGGVKSIKARRSLSVS
ncbi:Olfactory receptor 15 [Heterocephalus glaber]|uniref:Olfactory receptor 15 n=1 Tax=Heterocephalus glaber TaxID=10181 RepID=G5B1V1_HETGA|nr:Olfactory receptor 15 [Heterocephalus glaber]